MLNFDTQSLEQFIDSEFLLLKDRIVDNIISARKVASGRTIESLEVLRESDIDGVTISLIGRADFETMEKGNPPDVRPDNFERKLYGWSISKGIDFESTSRRWWFAVNTARKIIDEGDTLYREGGRKDIYSNELPATIERIDAEVDKQINTFIQTITI